MKKRWRLIPAAALFTVPFLLSQQTRPADRQEGYVDSRLCVTCHAGIAASYARTAMARSFRADATAAVIEDFRATNSYYHPASDTYFEMLARDGVHYQRRYQLGPDGAQTNIDQRRIDYVLGSGTHSRTYLSRTRPGALVELPLAWYAEKGGYWGMNPGYDRPDQPNARREISYECMFCHNSYPSISAAIPAGHDDLRSKPVFGAAIPEGIDCQRCHGPGLRHIELARKAGTPGADIRGVIVNPSRLPPARSMEVCLQCHLETTSFPFPHSIFRYGRAPFSYRAGNPLTDFVLFFDHAESNARDERFQIAGSAYRLEMSECFRKSDGRLQCTTCHDPHVESHGAEAAQHYNAVCAQCHNLTAEVQAARHPSSTQCVDCHMPKRRTDDVVHVVMTDHLIQRRPKGNLTAEVQERTDAGTTYRGEVLPYYPGAADLTPEDKLYLALAQVRTGTNMANGPARLEEALRKSPGAAPEFLVELADAWLKIGSADKAIAWYRDGLRRKPSLVTGWMGLGHAEETAGDLTAAAAAFIHATETDPASADAWKERGRIGILQQERTAAMDALQKSLVLDPGMPETHYLLGTIAGNPSAQLRTSRKRFACSRIIRRLT